MMEDWVECELQEIGRIFSGGTPKTKIPEYWGDEIPWITPADLSNYNNKFISKGRKSITNLGLQKSSAKLMPKGSVLFSSRAPIGYVVIAQNKISTNQGFKSIHPSKWVESEFVYFQLKQLKNTAEKEASGTTFKEISKKVFAFLPFKLPPLPIQRAIVFKIESLFSSLDSGIADLKKAQEQLKIYRQAVLKKAFEGELTKKWREQQTDWPSAEEVLERIKVERSKWIEFQIENGNNEAKRIKSKIEKFHNREHELSLPEKWSWTHFITACTFVIDCHNKTAPYEEDGIYLIRTTNIRDGKLNLKDKIKFVSNETYKFWSKRVFPEPGDIIFTREAPMGEAAIIPPNTKICLGQRTMILRTHESSLKRKYLLYNILSEVFKQRFRKSAIGTGVKHLRVGDVEALSFPLCSPQEQEQIVKEIESRLSVCDKVEESIKESLEQAQALRQSILKKAFEGELLTATEIEQCKQEADYEPASVLLERIKKEKKK